MNNAAQNFTTSEKTLVSTSPSHNYKVLGEVQISSQKDIENAISSARGALAEWQKMTVKNRVSALRKVQQAIENNFDKLAEAMTHEMGMPITGAKGSMRWSLDHIKWQLENFESCLASEVSFEDANEMHTINDTVYGLSGYIYTENRDTFKRLAAKLETGSISHNGVDYSIPHNPFCGWN